MGNEKGVGKLMGSRSSYQAETSSSMGEMAGVVPADKGFELKSGSKGRSSGPALPIYQGPGDGPTMGIPQSEGGASDDSDADQAKIIEPDQGFVKE